MDEAVRNAFLEDGAVLIKGALSQEQLAKCRAAYDWAVENPGRFASRMYDGTGQQSHVDNSNPLAKPKLDELMTSMPFGKLFADLWGSEHVWYFAEEIKANPGAYEILSWATEPGDVLLLHPGTLHGGAPVDAGFGRANEFTGQEAPDRDPGRRAGDVRRLPLCARDPRTRTSPTATRRGAPWA